MLVTICRLDGSYIDANRIILSLEAANHSVQFTANFLGSAFGDGLHSPHNDFIERGDLVVTTKVVGEDRYLWLLDVGEKNAGSVRVHRWYLQVPRPRIIDAALDAAERYEGSDGELLTLLSR